MRPAIVSPERPLVFVVDDDEGIRGVVSELVVLEGARAESFATATACLSRAQSGDAPSCLVLDVALPDLNGLDLHRELGQAGIAAPTLFITGTHDVATTVRAMKAGAVDFILKPFDIAVLMRAVRGAIEKDRVDREKRSELSALRARYDSLTPRQREVLLGVVAGRLNKVIAAEMGLSEISVKLKRARIMKKMGAQSLPDLVRIAHRLGLPDR